MAVVGVVADDVMGMHPEGAGVRRIVGAVGERTAAVVDRQTGEVAVDRHIAAAAGAVVVRHTAAAGAGAGADRDVAESPEPPSRPWQTPRPVS